MPLKCPECGHEATGCDCECDNPIHDAGWL